MSDDTGIPVVIQHKQSGLCVVCDHESIYLEVSKLNGGYTALEHARVEVYSCSDDATLVHFLPLKVLCLALVFFLFVF